MLAALAHVLHREREASALSVSSPFWPGHDELLHPGLRLLHGIRGSDGLRLRDLLRPGRRVLHGIRARDELGLRDLLRQGLLRLLLLRLVGPGSTCTASTPPPPA